MNSVDTFLFKMLMLFKIISYIQKERSYHRATSRSLVHTEVRNSVYTSEICSFLLLHFVLMWLAYHIVKMLVLNNYVDKLRCVFHLVHLIMVIVLFGALTSGLCFLIYSIHSILSSNRFFHTIPVNLEQQKGIVM